MWKITVLFTLIVCRNVSGEVEPKRGFVFTAPKHLLADSVERVCLSLHNVTAPAHVTLDLLHSNNDERIGSTQHKITKDDGGCFELYVPATQQTRGRLQLRVRFERHHEYSVNGLREVHIQHEPFVTFIESDKAMYKPGQLVRFRVLTLKHDFTAVQEPISKIWIENPSEVRVIQWLNVSTELGLTQLEYQLSHEPVLGTWKIKLEKKFPHSIIETKTFEVKKYVLPRFEIKISYPDNILADTERVSWNICSKYSYGQPVKGILHVKTISQTPTWRSRKTKLPEINFVTLLDSKSGCYDFNISGSELGLPDWEVAPSHIILSVSMHEQGTGHIENATARSTVIHQALKIEFLPYSRQNFKPGLPYYGKVRVLHSTAKEKPAANETIQLCLKVQGRNEWSRTIVECKNFTSNEDGFINFIVPPQHRNIVHLSFVATGVGYQTKYYSLDKRWRIFMEQPIASFDVRSWFSPTDSYVEVSPEIYGPVDCNKAAKFNIYYTFNPNDTKQEVFHYLVKSRGDIIEHKTIDQTNNQPTNINLDYFATYENILGIVEETDENKTKNESRSSFKKLTLSIDVLPKMSPLAYMMVYYAREDGEVIATTATIEIKECLANKIKMNWTERQRFPGELATLNIKTAPKSLCSVSAVDKSTHFLAPNPSILSRAQVFRHLTRFQTGPNSLPSQSDTWEYCSKKIKSNKRQLEADEESFDEPIAIPIVAEPPPFWDLRKKKKRSSVAFEPSPSQYVDTIQAFDDFGVVVLSDLTLETRPCYHLFAGISLARSAHSRTLDELDVPHGILLRSKAVISLPQESSPPAYLEHATDRGVSIRTHFPETWLWELVPTNHQGEAQIKRELPHTITDWMTSTTCISPQLGLGVAHKTYIRTFQPFFLDFIAPYSIKRGEILHLKVVLFNYLQHSLPVRLSLGDSPGIKLHSDSPSVISTCVESQSNLVNIYQITASVLGRINLTILAEVDPNYPEECGPEFLISHRDVLVKPILIQPEGFPVEISKSTFICPKDYRNYTAVRVLWDLKLPKDVVMDSARAKVSAVGDLMGPALQNLEKLINLPMGCGEQNMILFVPNLYVINYLNATGNYNPGLYAEAIKNMKKGYDRELTYRHSDGSYSAFGERDPSGSMWLTAFVVRSFAEARTHIYVDESDLRHSMRWITKKQLENGCFPTIGQVFHREMKGGLASTESNSAALTAYVMISLLETGLSLPLSVSNNAKYCLTGHKDNDVYTLSLVTYALTLLDLQSEAQQSFAKLLASSNSQDDLIWWENKENPSLALSVETTAYAILCLLKHNTNENMMLALKAVRWISKHRNGHGGFISTQDTIVALEALSKYAAALPQQNTNFHLKISAATIQQNFTIRQIDRFVQKQLYLPHLPSTVELIAKGDGCALVQAVLRYNVHKAASSKSFGLEARAEPISSSVNCTSQELTVCGWYRIADETSNMAVIEITMVTGYEVERESLVKLLEEKNTNVKRFEEEKNKVNLYFPEMTTKTTCVSFIIHERNKVDERAPATIKLYDYYHPDLSVSTSYKVEPKCRDSTIPHQEPVNIRDVVDEANPPMLPEPMPLENITATASDFEDTIQADDQTYSTSSMDAVTDETTYEDVTILTDYSSSATTNVTSQPTVITDKSKTLSTRSTSTIQQSMNTYFDKSTTSYNKNEKITNSWILPTKQNLNVETNENKYRDGNKNMLYRETTDVNGFRRVTDPSVVVNSRNTLTDSPIVVKSGRIVTDSPTVVNNGRIGTDSPIVVNSRNTLTDPPIVVNSGRIVTDSPIVVNNRRITDSPIVNINISKTVPIKSTYVTNYKYGNTDVPTTSSDTSNLIIPNGDKRKITNLKIPSEHTESTVGLNPSFIDTGYEPEFPDGIEGPQPTYVKPPSTFTVPTTTTEFDDCPVCHTKVPVDFNEMYCRKLVAFKMAIRKDNYARLLYAFSPYQSNKKLRAIVKLNTNTQKHCVCNVLVKGAGHIMVLDTQFLTEKGNISLESADNNTNLILGRSADIFPIEVVHGPPSVVTEARQTCDP